MERDQADHLIAVLERIATVLEQLTSGVTNHTVKVKLQGTTTGINYADDSVRDMEIAQKTEESD